MRLRFFAIAALLLSFSLQAQDQQYFKERYQRQIKNVGTSGVGVETIINNWEEAFPDDPDMLLARFTYCYDKCQSTEMVTKPGKKYLGQKPVLTLKDSLGQDVNYFQDVKFDDELFGQGLSALNKAISLDSSEALYVFFKITALLQYEKEDPSLSLQEINKFIDTYKANPKAFKYSGEDLDDESFREAIGEYCVDLFTTASENSYKAFLDLSTKMNKLYPKDVVFINNLGSYYQAHDKDYKKALKYYKKSLKLDPDNYAATQNTKIIQTIQAKAKKNR